MVLISLLALLYLPSLCYSQSSSSISEAASAAASSSSNAATVTVTSVSTLAIVILPSTSTPSSTTTYSYSLASSTSFASSTPTTAPSLTSTTFALQTVPYTGQAMLVGTCAIPQYTALPFPDGSMLEVPLVGCSDDRPDCCPSLALLPSNASQPAATNVVSLLNQAPLSICPKDFIDIDPICCPSGYSLYGQGIVGQTPCYTMVSTTMSIPQTVLESISSAVAETISAKSTTAAVSVIINQVFALGLPCVDNNNNSGLSTGAKAGIGVGAAVGGLIIMALAIWFCFFARKRPQKKKDAETKAAATHPPYNEAPGKIDDKQYPLFPPGTPQPGYPMVPGQVSPPMQQQGFGPHTSWPYSAQAPPEHMSISSDGARQYGATSPGFPPSYMPEMEASAYHTQSGSQRHELAEK